MAKNDTPAETTDEFAGIDLEEYTPEPKAPAIGPYDKHIRAAIAADAALSEKDPDAYRDGKRTAIPFLFATADVEKEIRLVQDSARPHERTARKISQDEQGDGYTKVRFILVPKQTRPRLTDEEKAARAAAKAASATPADDSDVPEEVAAEEAA